MNLVCEGNEDGGAKLAFFYDSSRVFGPDVMRVAGYYLRLLDHVSNDPRALVGSICLVTKFRAFSISGGVERDGGGV